jgi:hypothetical protein
MRDLEETARLEREGQTRQAEPTATKGASEVRHPVLLRQIVRDLKAVDGRLAFSAVARHVFLQHLEETARLEREGQTRQAEPTATKGASEDMAPPPVVPKPARRPEEATLCVSASSLWVPPPMSQVFWLRETYR